jgi:hypothetical protein
MIGIIWLLAALMLLTFILVLFDIIYAFAAMCVVLVVIAAGFGLLSSRNSAPPPVSLPASPQAVGPAFAKVFVAVAAERRVDVTVTVDDVAQPTVTLQPGESRTYQGDRLITLRLSKGGVADVSANALFATAAFVASLFPVTVYVPVLRYSALNTATLSASVALSFDG